MHVWCLVCCVYVCVNEYWSYSSRSEDCGLIHWVAISVDIEPGSPHPHQGEDCPPFAAATHLWSRWSLPSPAPTSVFSYRQQHGLLIFVFWLGRCVVRYLIVLFLLNSGFQTSLKFSWAADKMACCWRRLSLGDIQNRSFSLKHWDTHTHTHILGVLGCSKCGDSRSGGGVDRFSAFLSNPCI